MYSVSRNNAEVRFETRSTPHSFRYVDGVQKTSSRRQLWDSNAPTQILSANSCLHGTDNLLTNAPIRAGLITNTRALRTHRDLKRQVVPACQVAFTLTYKHVSA